MNSLDINHLPEDLLGVIVEFVDECTTIVLKHVSNRFAAIIRGCCIDPDIVCIQAADNGHFEVLKWAFAVGYPMFITPLGAVTRGNIEMIEWIHDIEVKWDRKLVKKMYRRAAAAGQLDVIKWLHSHEYNEISDRVACSAAKHGHQHVLEWLAKFGVISAYVFDQAAKGGHFELIKWLRKQGYRWGDSATGSAAGYGDLDILKWMRDNGCPVASLAYKHAASNGKLEILKWLYSEGNDVFVNIYDLSREAIRGGHIHVLEWLVDIKYPLASSGYRVAASKGRIDVFKWLLEKNVAMDADCVLVIAAAEGHLDMLKWLRAEGYPWDNSLCPIAVSNSQVEVLKWAIENGCPYYLEDCLDVLAQVRHNTEFNPCVRNDLEMMQYLHSIGCQFNKSVFCERAAAAGDLPMLKWLREHGCPWNRDTCEVAYRADPRLINWIHENGCPCRHNMKRLGYSPGCSIDVVAARGDLEALKFLHRGGPWDKHVMETICIAAVKRRHVHIIRWLHSVGYVIPRNAGAEASLRGYRDVLECLLDTGYIIHSYMFVEAARGGRFGLLKWLYEISPKPCAWADNTPFAAVVENNFAITKWLFEKGCPFDNKMNYYKLSGGNLKLYQWLFDRGVGEHLDGQDNYNTDYSMILMFNEMIDQL